MGANELLGQKVRATKSGFFGSAAWSSDARAEGYLVKDERGNYLVITDRGDRFEVDDISVKASDNHGR